MSQPGARIRCYLCIAVPPGWSLGVLGFSAGNIAGSQGVGQVVEKGQSGPMAKSKPRVMPAGVRECACDRILTPSSTGAREPLTFLVPGDEWKGTRAGPEKGGSSWQLVGGLKVR